LKNLLRIPVGPKENRNHKKMPTRARARKGDGDETIKASGETEREARERGMRELSDC
jgi:hypothetical protein